MFQRKKRKAKLQYNYMLKIVSIDIELFSSQKFINVEASSRHSFQVQINSIIDSFITQAPASFRRINKYIMEMLHANQLHNIFYTNWDLIISTSNNNYIMSTNLILYNRYNSSCSCATSSTCSKSIVLADDEETGQFSGLVYEYLPVYDLRLWTIECFYNSLCLYLLVDLIGSSYIPASLNISLNTRFTPISTVLIGTLIEELFIETWQTTTNYSNYFSICAPLTCRYIYIERNSALYMLTTFLGLYGGLTAGLQFIVWYSLYFYWKVHQQFTGRRRRIELTNKN